MSLSKSMLIAASALSIIRLTPKTAPFRRGGAHFADLDPLFFDLEGGALSPDELLQLVQEPLVDVDESRDGGEHWRRFSLARPDAADFAHPTDAARSPERAVDPTGPIVPRAPIETLDGKAAPANAADPAVPIAPITAGEGATARILDREEDRPVGDRPAADALEAEKARIEATRVEAARAEEAARLEAARKEALKPGKPPKTTV